MTLLAKVDDLASVQKIMSYYSVLSTISFRRRLISTATFTLLVATVSPSLLGSTNDPRLPYPATPESCRAFLTEGLQEIRRLSKKWQDCFDARVRSGWRVGSALDHNGKLVLVAVPECQPLANQVHILSRRIRDGHAECVKDARGGKRDRSSLNENAIYLVLEMARQADQAIETLNNPSRFLKSAVGDAVAEQLLSASSFHTIEISAVYKYASDFAQRGAAAQPSPVIRAIQSEQLNRVAEHFAALINQWTLASGQIDQFIANETDNTDSALRPEGVGVAK